MLYTILTTKVGKKENGKSKIGSLVSDFLIIFRNSQVAV